MRAGIALGSNLGGREAILSDAIGHLREIHEHGDFLLSSLHETEPMDCPPGSPLFLNGVVELETSLSPLELLHKCQNLEIAAGRPRNHGTNEPRHLDLDLLYCDGITLRLPELELPHPRITERLFVLAPLSEILPNLQLPGWDRSCCEYLSIIHKKQFYNIAN
jgi:2-amino-4-hydroxy-6-hydroxymethyldihydropteridine diphosphokinase